MSEHKVSESTGVFTNSDLFFDQLEADIYNARHSVWIQCMSFEADRIGQKLIEILQRKPTLDRTLLIDSYSKFVVNDTFLPGPFGILGKNNAWKERLALNRLLKEARHAGIRVKFTNPMGFLLFKYPVRNHKKLIVIDDHISYVGGINFTEHNFRWTDMMIRHSSNEICRALKATFLADLSGQEIPPVQVVDDTTKLYILNGLKTRLAFSELLSFISGAHKLTAITPYISYPFLDAVAKVPENKVILPRQNNKRYIGFFHRLDRYDKINFIYSEGEMIHTKLIIIDDRTVIYGSSNFDTISYLFEKEILLQKTDPFLVQQLGDFASRLINR